MRCVAVGAAWSVVAGQFELRLITGVRAGATCRSSNKRSIYIIATERPGLNAEMNDGGGQRSDTVRRSGRQRAPAVSYFESDVSSCDEEWVDSAEEVDSPSDQGKNGK